MVSERGRHLPWAASVALIGILFFSLTLRIENPNNRTFWGDEAWRAQQILHASSYSELLAGKYFGMEMPVQLGEYIFGKVGLSIFGPSELAFRVWSVLGSLFLLYFALKISLLHLAWPLTLAYLLLLGVSPGLIEHTHEFKPYIVEGALYLALLSVLAAQSEVMRQSAPRFLSILYAKCCLFGSVWLFTPVVPLFILQFLLKSFSILGMLVAVLSGIFGLLGVSYFLAFQQLVTARGVTDFWAPYTLDSLAKTERALLETLPATLDWYLLAPFNSFGISSVITASLLVMLFVVGGTILLRSPSTRSFGVLLVLPLPIMTALSLLGEYPFFMRVSSFYYPAILFGALKGFDALLPIRYRVTIGILFLTLTGVATWNANLFHAPHPGVTRRYENIHPHLEELFQRKVPLHHIRANYQARLALAFYRPEWHFSEQIGDYKTKRASDQFPACAELLDSDAQSNKEVWFLAIDRVDQYEHDKACCLSHASCKIIHDNRTPLTYLLGFKFLPD